MESPVVVEPVAAPRRPSATKTILAVSIGNALEWFELVVYGFLAVTMAKVFFPAEDDAVSLLVTLGTFGVTFVMRPVGSVVLGALADSVGRTRALTLSLGLMLAGTATIACAPSYSSAGLAAPLLVIGARLVQGFAAGGEFGSATALLAEQDPSRRGAFASWQFASQGVTTMLAAGFGLGLDRLLSPDELVSWGWRVPYVFGLLLGPVGVYIRRRLDEGEEHAPRSAASTAVRATVVEQRGRALTAMGLVVLASILAFTGLYMPTFAVRELGLAPALSFAGLVWLGAVQLLVVPIFGRLSDRVGRLVILRGAALFAGVTVVPAFALLVGRPETWTLFAALTTIALATAAYMGPLAAAMSELFPAGNRGTGLSVSYSFGVSLFGGFAPFVDAWLVTTTGMGIAPSFYILFGVAASLVAVRSARRYGLA